MQWIQQAAVDYAVDKTQQLAVWKEVNMIVFFVLFSRQRLVYISSTFATSRARLWLQSCCLSRALSAHSVCPVRLCTLWCRRPWYTAPELYKQNSVLYVAIAAASQTLAFSNAKQTKKQSHTRCHALKSAPLCNKSISLVACTLYLTPCTIWLLRHWYNSVQQLTTIIDPVVHDIRCFLSDYRRAAQQYSTRKFDALIIERRKFWRGCRLSSHFA